MGGMAAVWVQHSGFLILVPVASLISLGQLCLEQRRRVGAEDPWGKGFLGLAPAMFL